MSQFSNPDASGSAAFPRHSSNEVLEWTLRPWWRGLIFLVPIIALGVWMSKEVIRAAQSSYWADSDSIGDIQRVLANDPNNPDLLHRIGLDYSFNPMDVNTTEAVKYLRQAVALNPGRWDYWADLGTACDFTGDTSCSDEAFTHARSLNPGNPSLEWTLGNHYLLTDRSTIAFAHFRTLVEQNPDFLESTIRLCLRATHDPEQIYAQVIPHGNQSSARFAFLDFLVSNGDYDNAMKVWEQMIAGPDHSPKPLLLKPFLDYLTDHGRLDDANTVWDDLQHAGAIPPQSTSDSSNLLYDANFTGPLINTGFDWHTSSSTDLEYDFSSDSGYKKGKSARVDFTVGRNADYDLISQIVPVKPKTAYQFSAYIRSENLTSGSGPRLRVLELACDKCMPTTSDPTEGTTQWHLESVTFYTHPQTTAVVVSFWRPSALVALGDITGTVWLSDTSVREGDPSNPDGNFARNP
jgi:hypothetical protein